MKNNEVYWGFHNTNEESRMLDENYIALGWNDMGDLSKLPKSREAYYKKYEMVYKENKRASITNSAGQLYRFVNEAKIGDFVIFPTKFDRKVNIGIIKSDYYYDSMEREYPQKRDVEWIKKGIDRSVYSNGAKYEFGSFLSFFSIKNYVNEHQSIICGKNKKPIDIEEDLVSIEAILESTKDYVIKEISKNFKGYDFEKVVAWLLNAMGYKTKNSPKGGDHGKDIIVYRDELPPRIIVQVKSQDSDIKEETVQSLKGALNQGDYGLFVTLSNFSQNAINFLNRQSQIKSINGSEFVDLLLKYYEDMPDEFKEIIRLKKVYMPIFNDSKEE